MDKISENINPGDTDHGKPIYIGFGLKYYSDGAMFELQQDIGNKPRWKRTWVLVGYGLIEPVHKNSWMLYR